MTSPAPILELEDLHKTYGTLRAVDGVSLAMAEGEILSLLGPNGAGKTTLLSIASGLVAPTRGDVRIAGRSVVREPIEVKKIIGVVPQEVALYPTISARENLVFWGRMAGLAGRRLDERVATALELADLGERARDKVETYSGGMKRRVNVAVALLHEPRVLLMDEPTVGIDPQSRRRILDTVTALNAQGLSVLYTTHYMEEAAEISQRIAIMDHGAVIALGTLDELTRQVGHDDTVVLDLERPVADAGGTLTAALGALAGVRQAAARDRQLVVQTEDAQSVLPQVLAAIGRQGLAVQRLEIREPNLEAVFLHLTGRALRD